MKEGVVMMDFVERVRFLSNMYDFSQTDIASGTGISENQVSKYVTGCYLPTLKNAIKISRFFDCSLDYLFGIENIPNKYNYALGEANIDVFIERLQNLIKNKSLSSICENHNLTRNSFYEWKRKRVFPTMENFVKLALAFDVSIEFLIGRTDNQKRIVD